MVVVLFVCLFIDKLVCSSSGNYFGGFYFSVKLIYSLHTFKNTNVTLQMVDTEGNL